MVSGPPLPSTISTALKESTTFRSYRRP